MQPDHDFPEQTEAFELIGLTRAMHRLQPNEPLTRLAQTLLFKQRVLFHPDNEGDDDTAARIGSVHDAVRTLISSPARIEWLRNHQSFDAALESGRSQFRVVARNLDTLALSLARFAACPPDNGLTVSALRNCSVAVIDRRAVRNAEAIAAKEFLLQDFDGNPLNPSEEDMSRMDESIGLADEAAFRLRKAATRVLTIGEDGVLIDPESRLPVRPFGVVTTDIGKKIPDKLVKGRVEKHSGVTVRVEAHVLTLEAFEPLLPFLEGHIGPEYIGAPTTSPIERIASLVGLAHSEKEGSRIVIVGELQSVLIDDRSAPR